MTGYDEKTREDVTLGEDPQAFFAHFDAMQAELRVSMLDERTYDVGWVAVVVTTPDDEFIATYTPAYEDDQGHQDMSDVLSDIRHEVARRGWKAELREYRIPLDALGPFCGERYGQ
jgi:hypothetical protein